MGPGLARQPRAAQLMTGNTTIAAGVAVAHARAFALAGGLLGLGVYHRLGLRSRYRSRFNLDVIPAFSLIFVGVVSLLSLFGGGASCGRWRCDSRLWVHAGD